MIVSKDQERAEFALHVISELKDKEGINSDFSSYPSIILTNGLGQSLVYLKKKDDGNSTVAANAIVEWLKKEGYLDKTSSDFEVFNQFARMDQFKYIEAQQEALKISDWMKRYSKVFNEDSKGK